MIELFTGLSPVVQALLATMFTWGLTALWAAAVVLAIVAEELVPEANRGSPDIAAMSLMVGFSVMMALDVALG